MIKALLDSLGVPEELSTYIEKMLVANGSDEAGQAKVMIALFIVTVDSIVSIAKNMQAIAFEVEEGRVQQMRFHQQIGQMFDVWKSSS